MAASVIKSGLMDKKKIIKDKMFCEIPDKGIMQKQKHTSTLGLNLGVGTEPLRDSTP